MSYTTKRKNQSTWPYMIIGTAVVLVAIIALLWLGFGSKKSNKTLSVGNSSNTSTVVRSEDSKLIAPLEGTDGTIDASGNLVIDESKLTNQVSLYNFASGGITEQIIALKNSQGEAVLSFNTCQVCNGSPYAFFEENGDTLQCQNCGNTFSKDVVGQKSGGCNPVPITGSDVKVQGGKIVILKDFLDGKSNLFTNWKKAS